jgi:peptide-methionine (S)-S-oxide reductase
MLRKIITAALFATVALAPAHAAKTETAVFAGGCFWCVESDFDKIKGVVSTTSGYAGGTMADPTYEDHEGNQESVKVEFDPTVVTYETLVATFLRSTDVLDPNGQFCDQGEAYQSAIFVNDAAQKATALAAIKQGEADLGQKIVTPVKDFTTFANAEDYHQNYYLGQNRVLTRFGYVVQADAYKRYRLGCGRDARVKEVWGDKAFNGIVHSE